MTTPTNDQIIAQTILSQLGGQNKLDAMVGLKDLFSVKNGVRFKIKCRGSKANYVKIVLNSNDLYDIEFGKLRGTSYKIVKELTDIYSDQLMDIFEETTGLYLTLGARR